MFRSGAIVLGQPPREDPNELGRRRRTNFVARVRQVMLDRRMRQPESMGSRLLGTGCQDGLDDPELAVSRASGDLFSQASRRAAASHSSRASIGIS